MIVQTAIENIPVIYPSFTVDKHVIMPNHIHLLLTIRETDVEQGFNGRAMRAPTLSRVINQMKGYVTKQLGYSIWQKLFHDQIIRDEADYQRVWQYIDCNQERWTEDDYHP